MLLVFLIQKGSKNNTYNPPVKLKFDKNYPVPIMNVLKSHAPSHTKFVIVGLFDTLTPYNLGNTIKYIAICF